MAENENSNPEETNPENGVSALGPGETGDAEPVAKTAKKVIAPTGKLSDTAIQEAKIQTGRIPKPVPRGEDGITVPPAFAEPISSDTISLKRPEIMGREPPPVLDEEPEVKTLKIFCYNCNQKLDLTDMEPFSRINCPSCKALIIVPQWFDNYLLEEEAGEGGMAMVYRGLDLALDREVAIKVLNPDLAQENEKGNLFLHEARTAATLNHYAVLPIYTCGEFEDQPYIVMQWMSGGSLDKKLEESREPMPIRDVVKWILDIAEGLDNARRHGIIHHDIKPANIMLDTEGNVKIGDFGISQALFNTRSEVITELTKAWASPHYVSPEKVSTGKENYLGDIYSLGATFYHLIVDREPFDDDLPMEKLIRKRLDDDPRNPAEYRSDIPESLSSLIMAMMTRTSEARPSYRDIINELNVFLKSGGQKSPFKKRQKPKERKLPSATRTKIDQGELQ